ncbi:hypothetical protein Tco_0989265 [Tanacetum coccineum]|uniref:Uncharacterized protein n=1 Tax=Tanacetum coccineum TaxID=301880 RepID=A0ABQ5ET55_9ASTR
MSANSAVTYTSVHSEARSWSIPSEDPYEEAARQLLEQAPRSPEYVPDPMELEDHVPVYIPEPEHPEDLTSTTTIPFYPSPYPTPTYRATMGSDEDASTIDLSSSTSHQGRPNHSRQPGPTMARRVDCSSVDTVETRVRDTKEDDGRLRGGQLEGQLPAYEQESIQTRQDLARSEAYSRALEARVTVLEDTGAISPRGGQRQDRMIAMR